jgi:hypothetical protein
MTVETEKCLEGSKRVGRKSERKRYQEKKDIGKELEELERLEEDQPLSAT